MHWILSATPNYSLRNALHQSEWLMRSPFLVQRETLTRIESLERKTFAVSISQNASGLTAQTESQLSGDEVETITERLRRVLRIDDTFAGFYEKAYETPELTAVILFGAHTLRGATIYEDLISAVTATRSTHSSPSFHITSWIVDRLGDPLPRNPTLHAFPEPKALLTQKRVLGEMLPSELITQITHIAEFFTGEDSTMALMNDTGLPTEFVSSRMQSTFTINDEQLSLLMLFLGRYDYIPADYIAQAQARTYWMHTDPEFANDITLAFERWQPWGGLAYWLWDWSSVPEHQPNLNHRTEAYG